MSIISELDNKKILIWGYGREGKSTERFLQSHCPSSKIEIFEGKGEDIVFDNYDLVIKSPGINTPIENEKMTSQTELFLSQFSRQTIGITGTKGKSTTSSLLYTTLSAHYGKNVLLVGNIGYPFAAIAGQTQPGDRVVCEVSSFQLESIKDFRPSASYFIGDIEDRNSGLTGFRVACPVSLKFN